jgi:superfamily II DNA/RNA helicase
LFSATVPRAVQEVAAVSLKKGYTYVDTVGEEEEQTHLHVRQELVVAENADQVSTVEMVGRFILVKKFFIPVHWVYVYTLVPRLVRSVLRTGAVP